MLEWSQKNTESELTWGIQRRTIGSPTIYQQRVRSRSPLVQLLSFPTTQAFISSQTTAGCLCIPSRLGYKQYMQDLTALYMIWAYKVCHDCLLSLKLCLVQFQILLSNFIQIQVLMKAIQLCHNFLTLTFSMTLNLIVSYFAVSSSSSHSIKN